MNTETRYVRRTRHPAEGEPAPLSFAHSLCKINEPSLGIPSAVFVNGRWFTPATGLDDVLDREWREAAP